MGRREKDYRINNLRAIAILLVVFGHSIILYQNDWSLYSPPASVPFLNFVKELIDIIQMPLFISLSGFLFYFTYKRTSFFELIKKKASRLLVPYYFIGIFWMLPIRLLIGYPRYQGLNIVEIIIQKILMCEDNGHLWFLPFLFLCFILSWAINRICERLGLNKKISGILLFAIGFILYLEWWRIPENVPFGELFRSVGIWYIWFTFGYFLNEYKGILMKKFHKYNWFIVICGILLAVTEVIGIHSYLVFTRIVLVISLYLIIPPDINKVATFLSDNSFGIYLFHSPLVYITFSFFADANSVFVIALNFLVFGALSVYITIVLRSSKYRFLIGG